MSCEAPKFYDIPKDVKTSLDDLKKIFESSIEYIEAIQEDNDGYDLDDNIRWLVSDFSNYHQRYQSEDVLKCLKILDEYRERLNDSQNRHPEINPNDKFWICSECPNKITKNTCNEFLKSMCVKCIDSMTCG